MQHAACDGIIVSHQNESTGLSYLLKRVGGYAAVHLIRIRPVDSPAAALSGCSSNFFICLTVADTVRYPGETRHI